jgi:hypothetical protein
MDPIARQCSVENSILVGIQQSGPLAQPVQSLHSLSYSGPISTFYERYDSDIISNAVRTYGAAIKCFLNRLEGPEDGNQYLGTWNPAISKGRRDSATLSRQVAETAGFYNLTQVGRTRDSRDARGLWWLFNWPYTRKRKERTEMCSSSV